MSAGGLERLRERAARVPALVREVLDAPLPELAFELASTRRILVTGVGSSEGHARYLASLLAEELALPARFVATGAVCRDPGGEDAVLIVFSQGLSPNGCMPLGRAARWRRVVLVTAVGDAAAPAARRERLREVLAAGVRVIALPPELGGEAGSLLRVAGPVVAYAAALRLAQAAAAQLGLDARLGAVRGERAAEVLASAPRRAADAFAEDARLELRARPLALLAAEGYAERCVNLAAKVQEGLLVPRPGLWDVLDFVHGPFQQLHPLAARLVFLARGDEDDAAVWIERVRAVLPPNHELRVLVSALPGAYAVLDHEAQANALVLRAMQEEGTPVETWPGRGADAPIYSLGPESAPAATSVASRRSVALEDATSPEVGAALEAGRRTAVLALGSTEQHGPHLPLATDTWVADALAARFCAQIPEAQRCPTLALGCAGEHLGFPGTLSLAPETLETILVDIARSLSLHGFLELFVFSAHGGNAAPLRAMAGRLAARVTGFAVHVFADLEAVAAACAAVAARHGVSPRAAGHHAGEFETSILAALAPCAVRRPLPVGLLDVPADAQEIFLPDLRANAPNGVVGDARPADPRRAEAYLDAWVDVLVAAYREAKQRHQTKGTVQP